MEQKKKFLDSKKELQNCEKTTKAYLKYYRLKRSVEFLEQADKEEAWRKIQQERGRRTFRRQMFVFARAASVLAVFVALTYFAAHYGKVKLEKETGERTVC